MTAEPVRTGMTFSKSAYSKTLLNRADTNQRMIIMISREEAALKHFEMLARALETGNYYDDLDEIDDYINIEDLYVAIEALRQDERPKGRWVHIKHTGFHCSNCQQYSRDYKETNYCPNCGADMRDGEEE